MIRIQTGEGIKTPTRLQRTGKEEGIRRLKTMDRSRSRKYNGPRKKMRRQESNSEGRTHDKQKEQYEETRNTDPQTKFDTHRQPRQGNTTIHTVEGNCGKERERDEGSNEGKDEGNPGDGNRGTRQKGRYTTSMQPKQGGNGWYG